MTPANPLAGSGKLRSTRRRCEFPAPAKLSPPPRGNVRRRGAKMQSLTKGSPPASAAPELRRPPSKANLAPNFGPLPPTAALVSPQTRSNPIHLDPLLPRRVGVGKKRVADARQMTLRRRAAGKKLGKYSKNALTKLRGEFWEQIPGACGKKTPELGQVLTNFGPNRTSSGAAAPHRVAATHDFVWG